MWGCAFSKVRLYTIIKDKIQLKQKTYLHRILVQNVPFWPSNLIPKLIKMKHFTICPNGQGCWFGSLSVTNDHFPVCISPRPSDGALVGVCTVQAWPGEEST